MVTEAIILRPLLLFAYFFLISSYVFLFILKSVMEVSQHAKTGYALSELLPKPLPKAAQIAEKLSRTWERGKNKLAHLTGIEQKRQSLAGLERIATMLDQSLDSFPTVAAFENTPDVWDISTKTLNVKKDTAGITITTNTPHGNGFIEDNLYVFSDTKPSITSLTQREGQTAGFTHRLPLIRSQEARTLYQRIGALIQELPSVLQNSGEIIAQQGLTQLREVGYITPSTPVKENSPISERVIGSRSLFVESLEADKHVARVFALPEKGAILVQTAPAQSGSTLSPTFYYGPEGMGTGYSRTDKPFFFQFAHVYPNTDETLDVSYTVAATILQSLNRSPQTQTDMITQNGKQFFEMPLMRYVKTVLGQFVEKQDHLPHVIFTQQRSPLRHHIEVNTLQGMASAWVNHDPVRQKTTLGVAAKENDSAKRSMVHVDITPEGITLNNSPLTSVGSLEDSIRAQVMQARFAVTTLIQGFQDYVPIGFRTQRHSAYANFTRDTTLPYLLSVFRPDGTIRFPARQYMVPEDRQTIPNQKAQGNNADFLNDTKGQSSPPALRGQDLIDTSDPQVQSAFEGLYATPVDVEIHRAARHDEQTNESGNKDKRENTPKTLTEESAMAPKQLTTRRHPGTSQKPTRKIQPRKTFFNE